MPESLFLALVFSLVKATKFLDVWPIKLFWVSNDDD